MESVAAVEPTVEPVAVSAEAVTVEEEEPADAFHPEEWPFISRIATKIEDLTYSTRPKSQIVEILRYLTECIENASNSLDENLAIAAEDRANGHHVSDEYVLELAEAEKRRNGEDGETSETSSSSGDSEPYEPAEPKEPVEPAEVEDSDDETPEHTRKRTRASSDDADDADETDATDDETPDETPAETPEPEPVKKPAKRVKRTEPEVIEIEDD